MAPILGIDINFLQPYKKISYICSTGMILVGVYQYCMRTMKEYISNYTDDASP